MVGAPSGSKLGKKFREKEKNGTQCGKDGRPKIWEKREKSGRKGKIHESISKLPLMTGRANISSCALFGLMVNYSTYAAFSSESEL